MGHTKACITFLHGKSTPVVPLQFSFCSAHGHDWFLVGRISKVVAQDSLCGFSITTLRYASKSVSIRCPGLTS